jgi:UDP-glucose 4-epimerase
VRQSIDWICEALDITPALEFSGGDRGWSGDSPFIHLDSSRIRALGWRPSLPLRESVLRTLAYLAAHPQLLEPLT